MAEGARNARPCQEGSVVKSTMQLTSEVMLVQLRLGQQKSLLESDNNEMADIEIKKLAIIENEMKEASKRLGEGVSDEEKVKVIDIVAMAEQKVKEIQKQLERRSTRREDSRMSELDDKKSCTSKIPVGCDIANSDQVKGSMRKKKGEGLDIPKRGMSSSASVKSLELEH